jgi:purine-binding chemotaxis protein CheW
MSSVEGGLPSLLLTVGSRAYAIPLAHVIETMRPLPIERVSDMPSFVLGVSIIRGEPVPVVSVAALVAAPVEQTPTRFITIRVDDRRVALAVDAVDGIATLEADALEKMPPLLKNAGKGVVEAMAPLDDRLLLVLGAARLCPDRAPT